MELRDLPRFCACHWAERDEITAPRRNLQVTIRFCFHAKSIPDNAVMFLRWSSTLWVVRHGQSAGNVARDKAAAEGLARIALTSCDVDVRLSVKPAHRPCGSPHSASWAR